MSMNQFKEQFIKNLTHEELITEYEDKFALCEHLEDEVQRLSRERSKLAEEVVSLEVKLNTSEAKLSEFQEGIPIEKAKEDGTPVLAWKAGSYFHATVQHCEDGVWGRLTDDFMFKASREQPDRFITLPSQNSQTQEQINEQ